MRGSGPPPWCLPWWPSGSWLAPGPRGRPSGERRGLGHAEGATGSIRCIPTYQVGPAGNRPGLRHGAGAGVRREPGVPSGSSVPPGALRVSPEKQQTIGVRVARVQASPFQRTIRTVGRVTVDENRVYRLVASVDGIVRELHPNAAGTFVRHDQVLLTWYSPEFLGGAGLLLRPQDPRPHHRRKERADRAGDLDPTRSSARRWTRCGTSA